MTMVSKSVISHPPPCLRVFIAQFKEASLSSELSEKVYCTSFYRRKLLNVLTMVDGMSGVAMVVVWCLPNMIRHIT